VANEESKSTIEKEKNNIKNENTEIDTKKEVTL